MQRGMVQPMIGILHPTLPPNWTTPLLQGYPVPSWYQDLLGCRVLLPGMPPCVASTDEIPPVFKTISVKFSKPVLRPYNVHGTVLNLGTYEK